jgi:hypothetical protein
MERQVDGYEKIVRALMCDMTKAERQRLLAIIRATNNTENPFWAENLKEVQSENVTPES